MIGTFIATIIISTATVLAILMTGALESGQDGILLLQIAFGSALGGLGGWVIFFAMFTTLVADIHYGESNLT